MKFIEKVRSIGQEPLTASGLKVLQVNTGYLCNMACAHCHVMGSSARSEVMGGATIDAVLGVLRKNPFESLDVTGGAPELNPHFKRLVSEARAAGRRVNVRTNLTVFFEAGMAGLPEFYRDNRVELTASLPCYQEGNADRVRGHGSFTKSIEALRKLNSLGYGDEASLPLNLVYNPQGMGIAPLQAALEADYKRELMKQFGVSFTRLFTVTNMPIGRFRNFLQKTGDVEIYMRKLADAFNPGTLDGIMCRQMVNVGWDGRLFDCDFNQILGIPLEPDGHINEFNRDRLSKRTIAAGDHCFGCTAGQGSS